MNFKPIRILVALAVSLIAISACERRVELTPELRRVLEVRISLTSQGKCDVDYPGVNLEKHLQHRLKWISDDDHYTIIFPPTPPGPNPAPGTPFKDPSGNPIFQFDVPARSSVTTRIPEGLEGYYEYSINDNNVECKSASDPGINIKP